jgi:adenylate cyclase class 2
MAREREIKLRIADLPALRRRLARLGARMVTERVHEHNLIFDTKDFALAKREQLLRIRTESMGRPRGTTSRAESRSARRVVVTFKGPISTARAKGQNARHKVREEMELQIPDAQAQAKIFAGLGLLGWFQYEKYRTTFRLPRSQAWAKCLLIELDETPIGVFVELEGPAKAIDRAAQLLGFRKSDYILANYLVLYREYCNRHGKKPGHMLFAGKKRRPSR